MAGHRDEIKRDEIKNIVFYPKITAVGGRRDSQGLPNWRASGRWRLLSRGIPAQTASARTGLVHKMTLFCDLTFLYHI